jgi:cobalt-zinc-cadmium efflux system membrane fusion protein
MNKHIYTAVVAALTLVRIVGANSADEHDHDHEPATKPVDAAVAHNDGHDGHGHDDHGEGDHADEVKLTPEAVRRHDIRIAPVVRRPLAASFIAPARVTYDAEAMAHVGSLVKGRAVEVKARLGDVVKKGDELVTVESPELGEAQSDYLQKATGLSVAIAAVEPAQQSLERANKLYEKSQGVALAEVQKREAEFKAAQGAVQTAQASLDAAKNKLLLMGFEQKSLDAFDKSKRIDPRYAVRASISGTVIQREVTLGELVSPEKEALLVIVDLSTLWVVADVPEAKLAEVGIGSSARVRLATSSAPLEGKVSYIAAALDPGTRTAQVRIVVANNSNGTMRPGMFARAELTTNATAAAGLVVPEEAVQTVEGKPSVFVPVEGEPNTFATRVVKVGRSAGGMVPVASGLKEGEQVVVNGTFLLKAELGKAGAAHEH